MNQNANLNILRTVAVSTVLLQHLALTINVSHPLNPRLMDFLNPIGHAGVLAFFVHTSLVLMYSLGRLHATVTDVTWRFYVRRWFRIYPLAIASILLVLVLHLPSSTWKPDPPVTTKIVIANLFLVQNLVGKGEVLGPLWSLPYEVQMYVVLPALFFLAIRKRSYVYLAGLLIVACAGGIFFHWKTGHLNMMAYIPCFLSGVLCYALRNDVTPRIPAIVWPPFLIALICGFCAFNLHNDLPSFGSGWAFCILLGLTINLFQDSQTMWLNSVAQTIALYSYGIYLLHMPVLWLVCVKWKVENMTVAALMCSAGTLLASFLTFHLIEQPFINIGRRFSSSSSGRRRVSQNDILPAP